MILSNASNIVLESHMIPARQNFFENIFYIIRNTPVPEYWGFLALAISVIFFGSNSLPVKKFNIGDGLFYQMNVCLSIWTVGLITNCIRYFPRFYFLPMIGGFFWSTASLLTIPSIKSIGLSLSALVSGIIAILVGWANARFGLSGTKAEIPSNVTMNYFGVTISAVSAIFYIFIKSNTNADRNDENEPLISTRPIDQEVDSGGYFFDTLEPNLKRFIGIIITIICGILFGLSYIPYLYVMDNYVGASANSLDYIFSMYSGILLTAVVNFTIYCILKKNQPFINPKTILPAFLSGWVWGTGNCSFLFANSVLSQTVTFPIAGSVPSMIASLYGIFLFKEIKGKRNFFILIAGFTFTALGSILCGLSK